MIFVLDYSSLHKAPKTVDASFEALGATLFHYFAKADEAIGLELEVEPWLKRIWEALPEVVEKVKNKSITAEEEKNEEIFEEDKIQEDVYLQAKICSKTIEADVYRKVVRFGLELDKEISSSENIELGSYIQIFPQNDEELVKEFIKV